MGRLPMFPLGTVLLPGQVLPLHVFEERYRALVRRCLDGPPEFGVVLIERGNEVGGGDVRTDVGTVARIVEAAELPDGRWVLATVGARRIRVERWLDDDPHPWAEVTDWPDPPATVDLDERYRACVGQLRKALALRAECGDDGPPSTVDVADDPMVGSHQVAALGPFGPLDRQALLAAPSVEDRLDRLARLLAEEVEVLQQRLGADGS